MSIWRKKPRIWGYPYIYYDKNGLRKNIISGEIQTYIMTRMEFPIGGVFFAFLNLLDHTEDAIVKDLHVNILKQIDLAELQISVSIIK